MRLSTNELKKNLETLLSRYNESIQVQAQTKEQIIAIQAVIQDREDGDTNDTDSTDSND